MIAFPTTDSSYNNFETAFRTKYNLQNKIAATISFQTRYHGANVVSNTTSEIPNYFQFVVINLMEASAAYIELLKQLTQTKSTLQQQIQAT